MAVSKAEKAAYNDEIKDIKKEVDNVKKQISEAVQKKRKMPKITSYFNIEMAAHEMNNIDNFLRMNDLSVEMLGIKNSKFLEEGRKGFYRVLQHLEETVGNQVDRSLKENDDYLINLDRFDPRQVLDFVHRVHRQLRNLRNKFGQESKWKWSFVELQARVAVITKNITKFSDIAKYRDPRSDYFYERRDLMDLCKESLNEAAKQYRTKYEMAGRAREDLKKSIDFLAALRKIHVLFGEDVEASKLKNTIDAAKQTLAAEDKSKDKKNKEEGDKK